MALTATIAGSITARQTSVADLGTATFPATISKSISLTSGTAAGQADILWTDTRTLGASATENLDLAGVLTDAFGATLTAAKVKAVMISADAANTNNVVVGGHASAAFVGWFGDATDTIVLKPGYFFLLGGSGTGYTVTATTGDLIKVLNSAGTTGVTYSITVIGTSA